MLILLLRGNHAFTARSREVRRYDLTALAWHKVKGTASASKIPRSLSLDVLLNHTGLQVL